MGMSGRLLRPRQSLHAETANWVSRVVANGGTVSGSTVAAVDRFVKAINAAGIRDRFYRVNLFCGNSDASLAAVRTPLFRGPSLGGTQYGDATDTNNNFVAGDYAETGASGGLTGNGSTKCLRTGVRADQLPAGFEYDLHLSAYRMTTGNAQALLGSYYYDTVVVANRHDYEISQTFISLGTTGGPTSPTITVPCLQTGVRSSASSAVAYLNATAGTPYTGTISAFATGVPFTVFARNLITGSPPAAGAYSPTFYSSSRIGGYSIGRSMTAVQVSSYNSAMQAFQAALTRNV